MSTKKTNRNTKQNDMRERIGLFLLCSSAVILFIMLVPLGMVTSFTIGVLVGFMGIMSYPVFLGTLLLGILFVSGRRITLEKKYVALLGTILVCAALIAHLASSKGFISQSTMDEYLLKCYEQKSTVGGFLSGLVVYPIASVLTIVGSYILYSIVMIVCGILFVDFKLLKPKASAPKMESQPVQEFRNYPAGVIAKQSYLQHPSELFVENIVASELPFKTQSGVASQTAKAQTPVENKQTNTLSAHDFLYGDIQKVFSHFGIADTDTTPSQSFGYQSVNYEQSVNALYGSEPAMPQKAQAVPDIKVVSESIFSGANYAQQSPNVNYAQQSPSVNYTQQQPNINYAPQQQGEFFQQPFTESARFNSGIMQESPKVMQQPKENEVNYQQPQQPNIIHYQGKPKKVIEQQQKYNIVVPKVNNQTDKYIKNPNPIISGEQKSKEIIDKHKQQMQTQSNLFGAQFQASAKVEEPVNQGIFTKPDFNKAPTEPQNTQSVGSEREQGFEQLLAEQREFKNQQSVPPLDFNFSVPYKDEKPEPQRDNSGAYEVLQDKKPFDIRVEGLEKSINRESEIEKNLASLRGNRRSKHEKNENQIGIEDYAEKVAKEQVTSGKRFKDSDYVAPPIELLDDLTEAVNFSSEDLRNKAAILEETLQNFKFPATVVDITPGPAVTRYEVQVPQGIKLSNINSLTANIAYSLASNASGIRIEAPIPNKTAIGIEVPNESISVIGLKTILESTEFKKASAPLTFALGQDIAGANMVCDLAKMPHLLIAGATGSGKSVCLQTLITSLIYKSSPSDLRLILIDPKRVEFNSYEGLPHLYIKEIITECDAAVNTLAWAIDEMERRYTLFSSMRKRNIVDYNASEEVRNGTEAKLPYLVIIMDEMGDLMLQPMYKKEVEEKIRSLTQKARAAGIHLVLATQRPSVDVITGVIKANLPSRIAFMVSSYFDSKTVLDKSGAEKLLGRGDMLFAPIDKNDPIRIQGAYITENEVSAVVEYIKKHNETDYDEEASAKIFAKKPVEDVTSTSDDNEGDDTDELLPKAILCILEHGKVTTSFIQRKMGVGYARAAKIVDQMEERKFISAADSNNARTIFITKKQFDEIFGEES